MVWPRRHLQKNKMRVETRRRGKKNMNKRIGEKGKENVSSTLMLCLNIKPSRLKKCVGRSV